MAERASLVQLYAQDCHSTKDLGDRSTSRLVVSEDLWFVGVLNGVSLDFYDLSLKKPEDGLRSLNFLSATVLGTSPATEAALSPHDPSVLAVGTASGSLAFLRLRRVDASASIRPSGPLLVHKTIEKALAPPQQYFDPDAPPRAVEAIRFHPTQPGLCAVACAGAVHLVQHDVGLLASIECCKRESDVHSLAWCGPLLACGEADGGVRVWRLAITLVDPRRPSEELKVEAEQIGVLTPPVNAAPASVSSMRWLHIDSKSSESGEDDVRPLGVLCCGYTATPPPPTDDTEPTHLPATSALLRAWSISSRGEVYMLASLPVAPLKGAVEVFFSESLAPTPLPSASHASGSARQKPVTRQASNGAEVVGGHPLRARSFRAAADPRWLLCGASGSSSLFALPWGRASTARTAEATFPTAVELLCAPSLTLDPPPQSGVRGIHKLGSDACRAHVAEVLGVATEEAFFAGPHALAGCEIALVLSDRAIHIVLHATAPEELGGAEDVVELEETVYAQAAAQAAEEAAQEELDAYVAASKPGYTPIVAHLLPAKAKASVPAAASIPKGGKQTTPTKITATTKAMVVGGLGAKARAQAEMTKPPPEPSSELYHRIAELEQRAVSAEEQLAELRGVFNLFAARSREEKNALISALDQLVAEKAARESVVVAP